MIYERLPIIQFVVHVFGFRFFMLFSGAIQPLRLNHLT
jgi:hypothetical protein